MVINIVRCGREWSAECVTSSGLVVARVRAGTWHEAWFRLASVLRVLRVRYSLRVSA